MLIHRNANILEVVQRNPIGAQVTYTYYDVANWKRSVSGKKGAQPSTPMTKSDIDWVKAKYLPQAVQDNSATQDLVAIAIAAMIADGSYDRLTRSELIKERNQRVQALLSGSVAFKPTRSHILAAEETIRKYGLDVRHSLQVRAA